MTATAISLYAHDRSPQFERKLEHTCALLSESVARFGAGNPRQVAQANSLGVEDMVITDLLHHLGLDTDIFVLDTGCLHAETLELLERARQRYRRDFSIYRPHDAQVQDFVARHGADAMYVSVALRKECCHLRKLQPLERALGGKAAWITGLRREQSGARATVPEVDTTGALPKISPLVDWTLGDIWHYVATRQVPYNELHDRFYPSIGCQPCTRAVTLGEDFRSGRWWWEADNARECGLHTGRGEAGSSAHAAAVSVLAPACVPISASIPAPEAGDTRQSPPVSRCTAAFAATVPVPA